MTDQATIRNRVKAGLVALPKRDIHWLLRAVRRELTERNEFEAEMKRDTAAAMAGMANVMAGVTWALACRQSLRRSKEHAPDFGKKPASGEMWLPAELLKALRHEIEERQWSPLTAPNAKHCMDWLRVEAQRKAPPAQPVVAEFRVQMVTENAAVAFQPARTGSYD